MGQGPLVFSELPGPQGLDVLDPLHRLAAHVGRETLVAEDGQTLLQAQLEPVPAGDPVARPVVEVLVGHHALDAFIVQVRRRLRVGQQQGRVEDVEALVLHGSEVEVAHGDDHEEVQVVLAAKGLLVPAHGPFQGVHGVGRPGRHARVDIDLQLHIPPARGDEAVGQFVQFAGHQGEEVAGLGEGIVPHRITAPVRSPAALHQVAVRQ